MCLFLCFLLLAGLIWIEFVPGSWHLSVKFPLKRRSLLYKYIQKWSRMGKYWPPLYTPEGICHIGICIHAKAICEDLGIDIPRSIYYGPIYDMFGCYQRRYKTVFLGYCGENYTPRQDLELLHTLAHELRHKWQVDNGYLSDEEDADKYADRWIEEEKRGRIISELDNGRITIV